MNKSYVNFYIFKVNKISTRNIIIKCDMICQYIKLKKFYRKRVIKNKVTKIELFLLEKIL